MSSLCGHVVVFCTCGFILSQCRCFSLDKKIIISLTPCTHTQVQEKQTPKLEEKI